MWNPDILKRKILQAQRLKELRVLQNFKEVENKVGEDPTNLSQTKKILTLILVSPGTQKWSMLGEANTAFKLSSPLATVEEETCRKFKPFSSGVGVPVTSLYRVVKLTFPRDINRLSQNGTIRTEMGQEFVGEAISVLTPGMFITAEQQQ